MKLLWALGPRLLSWSPVSGSLGTAVGLNSVLLNAIAEVFIVLKQPIQIL